MSMLAEPRRKQRISANPRGKFFMEDDNNMGKVLLHKMGWKNGDGLGNQNQGMSEPIRPKVQSTNKGLGYDVKTDPWVEHFHGFNQVLEKLNQEGEDKATEPDVNSGKSNRVQLENMSKMSRARIHYTKFVKNKDLSSISHQDWNCIFGKPKQTGQVVSGEEQVPPVGGEELVNGVSSKSDDEEKTADDGFNTINKGSMHDYFKLKLAEKLSKLGKLSLPLLPSEEEQTEEIPKQTKPKRRKVQNGENIESTEVDVSSESVKIESLGVDIPCEVVSPAAPNKKSKKRKHFEIQSSGKDEREDQNSNQTKKRAKKRSNPEINEDVQENLALVQDIEELVLASARADIVDAPSAKLKKQKKKKDEFNGMETVKSGTLIETKTIQVNSNEEFPELAKKSKKKSVKKHNEKGICASTTTENKILEEVPSGETTISAKKSKKKKKRDANDEDLSNLVFIGASETENGRSKKSKKKAR